jgi:16S rRNA (guanine966-N2)-methyltransferase
VRIVAGRHKGRTLLAPPGTTTRPTADRVRVSLFDMLWHAPWGGRMVVDGARVLDVFAGTGALGLEALSRGAAHATFIEQDQAALAALRQNISRCAEVARARVLVADALKPPRPDKPASLVFLDPPYASGLNGPALAALSAAGWLAPGALISAEFPRGEAAAPEGFEPLAERAHGQATLLFLRAP